jgi:hypothetical protein
MPATLAILLPLLQFLASTAGAGVAASRLFDWLRAELPPSRALAWPPLAQRALALLHAPRYARVGVLLLSALVSLLASAAVSALSGRPLLPDLDAALSASLAAIVSQLWHARTLSADVDRGGTIRMEW